jgi:hypothetical protein
VSEVTLSQIVADIRVREALEAPVITALYASAGSDTKPLTFTHPRHLADCGVSSVPSPNLFVYVDRGDDSALSFGDALTSIATVTEEPIELAGISGRLLLVHWRSETHDDRTLAVVRLRTENETLARHAWQEGWVPDLFIGVCDGCRFGGNQHCVNKLALPRGMPESLASRVPTPRWWITDHFQGARPYGRLEPGDLVEAEDRRFPFRFKMLALLSQTWGHYRSHGIPGATLFEVERV